MRNLSTTTKHNLALIGAGLFVLVAVVLVVLAVSPRNVASGPVGEGWASSHYDQKAGLTLPLVQLEGDWYIKEDAIAFQAKVEGESIKIAMIAGDGTSATYWHGTFKTAESPNSTITSNKTEAADEIVLSQSASKDFKIGPNAITFTYSALGFSRQITMTR